MQMNKKTEEKKVESAQNERRTQSGEGVNVRILWRLKAFGGLGECRWMNFPV